MRNIAFVTALGLALALPAAAATAVTDKTPAVATVQPQAKDESGQPSANKATKAAKVTKNKKKTARKAKGNMPAKQKVVQHKA